MTISDIVTGAVFVPETEPFLTGWAIPRKNAAPDIIDDVLCQELTRKFDLFILGSIIWYYEGGVFHPDRSGSVMKTVIRMHLPQECRRDPIISRIHKLLLSDANLMVDEADVNDHQEHWINTRSGMFDVLTWELKEHSPEYRSINQIPHFFDGSKPPKGAGKVIQGFLNESLPDKQDQKTVFEMTGESCSVHTDFQKCVVFQGQGATGKSTLLNVIEASVGIENVSNVPLQKLESRFYPVRLIGKLVNMCSDLPSSRMEFTGNFKAAVCSEGMNDSYKGKDQFDFKSHAKMWFSCNELPTIADRSNGFYRRIVILTMNQKPKKPDPNLTKKLTAPSEINYFLYRSFKAYAEALKRGKITESKNARMAVMKYRCSNDTTEGFMKENYEITDNKSDRVLRSVVYKGYEGYCDELKTQALNPRNFYEVLRQKGFQETSVKGLDYFCYLKPKEPTFTDGSPTQGDDSPTPEDEIEIGSQLFG